MNINWIVWIENFIGAFTCCLSSIFIGKILLKQKLSRKFIYNIIVAIMLTVIIIANSLVFDNIIKIFGVLLIHFFIYKMLFKEDCINSLIFTAVTYLMFVFGELTLVLLISIVPFIFETVMVMNIIKSIVGNIIVAIFAFLYTICLKKIIMKVANKINKNNVIFIFLLGVATIFIVISSMYKLYLNNWVLNYSFVLNTIIIVGCVSLMFILIKQNINNKEISDKYELLNEYLKTSAELIEKYSSTIHKYKNNLIAIKGYMKSDMEEANKYVDGLLDNYKTKKYNWFSKINYITIDTIRYLVYYKLSKAEELNLKITVIVSKDIKNIEENFIRNNEINIILEILGEYFDNAIYASSESDKKELSFNLYIEEGKLIFELANTYKEKFDINLISKNGYTTKGENHGFGLYDVEKVIKKLHHLNHEYAILDEYFVVRLVVDNY